MKKAVQINNDNGSVVVLALIMVVLLSLLGVAVSRTSSIDVQVASNETQSVQDLYKAESADKIVLESTSTWMTDTFLQADPDTTTASWPAQPVDTDGDLISDTTYEIRCIKNNTSTVGGLSTYANDLPVMSHISTPPPDSGYSLKYFEVRRYGITATTNTTNNRVQIGAYKVFNKF